MQLAPALARIGLPLALLVAMAAPAAAQYGNMFKGIDLEQQDMAMAVDVARSLKQPMPIASLVREMMTMAMAGGYEGHDVVAVLDMYRKMNRRDGRN